MEVRKGFPRYGTVRLGASGNTIRDLLSLPECESALPSVSVLLICSVECDRDNALANESWQDSVTRDNARVSPLAF